jgi:uncharacterized protein (TIGR02246 family)
MCAAPASVTSGDAGPPRRAPVDAEIREADQAEVQAILRGDPEQQVRIWAEDFVVTNIDGEVFTRAQVMRVFEQGLRPYRSFDRVTEDVRVYGTVAVSRGRESVVPAGPTAPEVEPERRRYTHVWVHQDGRWQLAVRQSGRVRHEAR